MLAIFRVGRATGAAAGISLLLSSAALAGPIVDHATEAEQKIAAGDAAGALAAFNQAADAFWDASPLQFRVALFADGISGYGKYTPRTDTTFHAGDMLSIYLEPVGYGFAADGDGYKVSYGTGIEIRTPGGLILAKTDDFGKLEWSGRAKSHEVFAAVSVGLPPGLNSGEYQLILTLNDAASGKSATTTLPFTVAQ